MRKIGYVAESKQEAPMLHGTADSTVASSAVKPGIKSTEFWLVAFVIAGVVVLILFDRVTVDEVVDLWPLFLGSSAYSLSRGIAKRG